MPVYQVYGLALEADHALIALAGAELPDSTPADVHLRMFPAGSPPPSDVAARPWHETLPDDAGNVLTVTRTSSGSFRFAYTDGIEFVIEPDGSRVSCWRPASLTVEDAAEYLLGPVLGFILRSRGSVCLHAAAIRAGDGCFAIMAPAGHGKSTTAAACARLGMAVLTEDVLVLDPRRDGVYVVPGYPRVRLWPTAVAGLYGDEAALPRITPDNDTWDKRFLALSGAADSFCPEPLPLRVVFTHERRETTRPSFEQLAATEALVALLGNVYTLVRPSPDQRAREFDVLRRLAETVPVERYSGRYGIEFLDGHCRALQARCRETAATSIAG